MRKVNYRRFFTALGVILGATSVPYLVGRLLWLHFIIDKPIWWEVWFIGVLAILLAAIVTLGFSGVVIWIAYYIFKPILDWVAPKEKSK